MCARCSVSGVELVSGLGWNWRRSRRGRERRPSGSTQRTSQCLGTWYSPAHHNRWFLISRLSTTIEHFTPFWSEKNVLVPLYCQRKTFSVCVTGALCLYKCPIAKIKSCSEIVTLLLASKRQILEKQTVCVGAESVEGWGEGETGRLTNEIPGLSSSTNERRDSIAASGTSITQQRERAPTPATAELSKANFRSYLPASMWLQSQHFDSFINETDLLKFKDTIENADSSSEWNIPGPWKTG